MANRRTVTIPVPLVAPMGWELTDPEIVEGLWETFVKPSQSDDAPPQSIELRCLMAILRSVHKGLQHGVRVEDESASTKAHDA